MKRLFLIFALVCFSADTQDLKVKRTYSQSPQWLNVQDFGAKCDGKNDDTPGVLAAAKFASVQGKSTVYLPLGCLLISPLALPPTKNSITIFFEGLTTWHSIKPGSGGYVWQGAGGAPVPAFATEKTGSIEAKADANPVFDISGVNGLKLKDISIQYYAGDAIHIKNSNVIELENVWTHTPLIITGGFGYKIIGGGYRNVKGPSIDIENDPRGNEMGIVRIDGVFLSTGGILVNGGWGGTNSISINHVLFENAATPFLTVFSGGKNGIYGVDIANVNMADSASPAPALVEALGDYKISSFTIKNCHTDGAALTSGKNTIYNLEVWSQWVDYGPGVIAQKDNFIYHGPSGIKDTMPRLP